MKDSTVLIIGGTGTFGNACVEELLKTDVHKIIIFSRDEKKQWDMQQRIKDARMRFFIGDVRDRDRLYQAFVDVNYIIHAAALKQVPALEYNPMEAIKTNIIGTQNVITCAVELGVKKVLALSTDKAVNPINLYGATKLCAEKLIIASSAYGGRFTKLSVVRYGNVMGSRGSVIEVFEKQRETGVVTVTDERMTRFVITPQEAVLFVLKCLESMKGGEIFVPRLESMRIIDLAKQIAPDCDITFTGIRAGEKIHETLVSADEFKYVTTEDDRFIIKPKMQPFNGDFKAYTSS